MYRKTYGLLVLAGALVGLGGILAISPAYATAQPDLSGIGLATDSGQQDHWIESDSNLYAKAEKSSLWDKTPSGMVFHSCDYGSLPNGSHVDTVNNTITLPDGKTETMKPCAYPRIEPGQEGHGASLTTAGTAAPGLTPAGWFQGFDDPGFSGFSLTYLYAKLAVPSAPSVSGGQTESAWSALGDTNGTTLVQPGIGWGPVGCGRPINTTCTGSGNHLWEAAYYFWSGNAVSATFKSVNAGDTVEITDDATSCNSSGGNCTFYVDAFDDQTGADSTFSVTTGLTLNFLIGGMYEAHSLSGCNETFANGHLAWRDEAFGAAGTFNLHAPVTPNFIRDVRNQQCSMNTINYQSETGGDVTWTP